MTLDPSEIQRLAEEAGQGHLFTLLNEADESTRNSFLADLGGLDWNLLGELKSLMLKEQKETAKDLAPAPSIRKGEDDQAAKDHGEALLAAGKVAAFIVAGGQGSRLGFDGPKGMYPASPIRQQTLFQLFAAKIAALNARYEISIPWYVMTSRGNHQETLNYFSEQNWFGLGEDHIRLFSQDMLPAMDHEGHLLLEAPAKLFLSPNGHGGSLLALRTSGALAEMAERGIEQIFYFQVDNPLASIADPVFVGHHDLGQAEMSTKVVAKRDAAEKVGVVGLIGGKYGVIEYSDLSQAELEATTDEGDLQFKDGNIAVHMLRRDFVERLTQSGFDLPYHIAKKSIPDVDPSTGQARKTAGVKFETFVFDALANCEKSIVLEVDRKIEFAPIKNAEGEDSPSTSRDAQVAMFASWLEIAGLTVPRHADGKPAISIDIDPRFADCAEALCQQNLDHVDMSGDVVLGY